MSYNFDNERPIYVQLLEYIRLQIVSGVLKPSDRLPSVRDLALNMKVNPNTMQKALQELESEGMIYTERTNGKYVTDNTKLIQDVKKKLATEIVDKYFDNMKNIGISKEEAVLFLQKNGGVLDGTIGM